ncbi:restriction endonuclease subunit S [Riemerella anatipestifer]|uniref:restriction endonuclease subunit S n=1 Tax=Riemerella anatipestifer TaxID=34085 RepID=UPI00129EE5AB|nr:restriction endonuclease subunit S [Riemerella anatipestifer]MRM96820.1 restriction endonuclease subunit S [Riemerella anatipestifer]MRM99851.1 restriction endonuclease subunit S [Riemerella anatipestifer]MRN01787.1 restriction endonuclease subunit S [Riemerella anatipestifer]
MKDKLPKGWEWKTLELVCDRGSSNISQNQIQENDGDFAIYGASGFIKNINFYHQSKPYIGIVKDGAGVGRVMLLEAKTSVIGTLQYLIPRDNVDLKYLYYFLLGIDFNKYVSGSTIPHIYYKNYKNEPFLFIPISEQKQIVSVLDKTFEKLDQAITLVEENIQKLKQLNESVLDEVFERLRLKNKIVNLGDFVKTTSGGTPNRGNKEFWTNGTIHWLKSGELNDSIIYDCEEKITIVGLDNSSAKVFPKGTLLLALYGATAGKLGFLNFDSSTNQAVCGIFPDESKISKEFIFYFLKKKRKKIIKDSFGGAQPNISQTYVRNIKIPLPSIPEQQRIVAYLDQATKKNQKLTQYYQDKLEALKRLKNSVLDSAFKGELRKEKIVVKQPNINFYYMQLIGASIQANRMHNIAQGEMAIAKDMYLLDRLYDVPTQMNFVNHSWGPFAPVIKKVINNNTYFGRKKFPNSNATYVDVLNEEILLKTISSEVKMQIIDGINTINQQLFSKISPYKRAETKELLATVLKCIEDTQSIELTVIRHAMQNWKIEQGKFKTKAEKFPEKDTIIMIKFIVKENWHLKVLK